MTTTVHNGRRAYEVEINEDGTLGEHIICTAGRRPGAQYIKVATAGRLSLFHCQDTWGTHWLATKDNNQIIYEDYYERISVRRLRQYEAEWNLAGGNEEIVPGDTPKNWQRYEGKGSLYSGDFNGRKG